MARFEQGDRLLSETAQIAIVLVVDDVFELQAEMLKALGNPRRLEIFRLLASGPLEVSAIVDRLGLAPSAVSQSLAIMKAAGLVERVRDAPGIRYRLADADYVTACQLMYSAIRRRLARLAEVGAGHAEDDRVEAWSAASGTVASVAAAAQAEVR
jgi:DNA-binding transcriptional ArsR family regulator